jgi:hypothetical protein
MANLKMNIEGQLDDQILAKFVESLSKAEEPPEKIEIELSNISGTISIKTVYKEESKA